MEDTNPITRITGVTYGDLATWSHDLDKEIKSLEFNSRPFPYRAGIQRFRIAIDQLAAAMRGIDENEIFSYYGAHKSHRIYKDPREEIDDVRQL